METKKLFDIQFGITKDLRDFWDAGPQKTMVRDVELTDRNLNPSEALIEDAENGLI